MSTAGKPIECKAAVCWSPKSDLVIETITVDPPKDNEVRVKMVATGICFSDLHIQNGGPDTIACPVVLGHESAAIVESVGSKVTMVKPGDSVIPMWCYQCGKCPVCVKGKRNICLLELTQVAIGNLIDGTTRMSCKGQRLKTCLMVAGFSEYSVLPEDAVAKLNPGVPLEKIAIYGCCVPTGYGAAKYTAKVEPGSTVAVIGLGAIGLCAVLGARDCKATKIIGIDINNDKKDIGLKFGVTDFVNPLEHPGKKNSDLIKELTGGLGADFSFVCVGKDPIIDDALEGVRVGGGEVILIAIPEPGSKIKVDGLQLLFGKTIKASWCGDCFCHKHIPELVDLYMQGTMPTDLMITNVISLDEINEGMAQLRAGKSIRTVVKF